MKVAIYARVSTAEQNVATQIQQCQRYCDNMDHEVFDVYADVISGTTSSRPEFNRMLEDMRKWKFRGIIVSRLDRMGRSLRHLLGLIEEFTNKGIHFMAVNQNLDTSTSTGKLQLQIMGAFAEFERNIISERTKEGLANRKSNKKRGKDKIPRKRRGGKNRPLPFLNKDTLRG